MKSAERMGLLATIWFSMALVGIAIATGSDRPELLVIPIAVSLLMTVIMVTIPDIVTSIATPREKAKHQPQDKLSMLMEIMDEDERAAFKETLKRRVLEDKKYGEDGELSTSDQTLAALLDKEQARERSWR